MGVNPTRLFQRHGSGAAVLTYLPNMSRSQAEQPEAVRSPQAQEPAPAPAQAGAPVAIPMHLSELKAHHVSQLV